MLRRVSVRLCRGPRFDPRFAAYCCRLRRLRLGYMTQERPLPDVQVRAVELFNELTDRGLTTDLYVNKTFDGQGATAQIQIKVQCFGDKLIWAAQLATEQGVAVDAVDGGLLLNIL